jgi:hypothetical protein
MAVGFERFDRGEAADHRGSRRARSRRPALDRPTDRLAPLIALRLVFHDAAKPAHALGGVNTFAAGRSGTILPHSIVAGAAEGQRRDHPYECQHDAAITGIVIGCAYVADLRLGTVSSSVPTRSFVAPAGSILNQRMPFSSARKVGARSAWVPSRHFSLCRWRSCPVSKLVA